MSIQTRALRSFFPLVALPALSLIATGMVGCMPKAGPYVRLATATRAELEKVENEDTVWYEFRPGDVVPIRYGFIGAGEGGAELAPLRAKRRFFIVRRKNQPMEFSFDGATLAHKDASQFLVAILPRDKGEGAQILWLNYLGEEGDPRGELKKVLEQSKDSK